MTRGQDRVTIDGANLRIEDVVRAARDSVSVEIGKTALERTRLSRNQLEGLLARGKAIYGITTGFGALATRAVQTDDLQILQLNLLRSHATGTGESLPTDIVRAMLLLRANTFLKGVSGVKPQTVQLLVEMLNRGVHPVVPSKGSVGASGDLAPLAHLALCLVGEGQAEYQGVFRQGGEALRLAGLSPLKLGPKEGLALINGTQMMTGIGCLVAYDAANAVKSALTAAALTIQALKGTLEAFDPRLHAVRPHSGQRRVAETLRSLLQGSGLLGSSEQRIASGRFPHDPYSLRCMPQVMGPVLETLDYLNSVLSVEINSATDNPLIFPDEPNAVSGGNFHGEQISMALDYLAIALTVAGNMAERRIARLLDERLSEGLPAFLIPKVSSAGLNSGLMPIQFTAAALSSENKILAHPASADSIPTSADFEDFVSMGPTAALKCRTVVENLATIVAIELLCACQAADLRGPDKLSLPTKHVYDLVRVKSPMITSDRSVGAEVSSLASVVKSGLLQVSYQASEQNNLWRTNSNQ